MNPNKLKRFYKLEPIENSYEDDCQIFYPTEWDEQYLAYKYFRQHCIHEICGIQTSYIPMSQLYNVDNATHSYNTVVEDFQIYQTHLEFIQAYDNMQLELIPIVDSEFEVVQLNYNENFEDVDEEDLDGMDLDYQFMENYLDTTQYKPSEASEENGRRYLPLSLTLGRFLCDKSASRIKVVKQRKAKQIRSIKVKCVNKRSYNNLGSIVHSTVQIEEITSTKTSCSHLAEVRITTRSSNEKVDLNRIEIDTVYRKEVKTHKTFSQAVSWGASKFSSNNPTIFNEEVDDRMLMDNPWVQLPTEDLKRSKTFSEIVPCGPPKISSKIQTVSNVGENLEVVHPSVHILTEKCIPSNTILGLTATWSKIVKGEKHTRLVLSKSVKTEVESKVNKRRKCRFVKYDELDTVIEIVVEQEPEVLYIDALRRQRPELICNGTVPKQSTILMPAEAKSKRLSSKQAVVGLEKQSIIPAATSHPQEENYSTKIVTNNHLEKTIKCAPESKGCPKQKQKWILKECRRKSSKKS